MHVVRNDPSYYAQILTLEDLDEYLSRNDIRYPSLRMMRAGRAIPLAEFSRPLKFGSYAADGLVDVDRVYQLYREGSSLILQMMRSSIKSVSAFANQLQRDLQFNVEGTIYVTPPSEQGFTTHFDTHSVIVLQIAGCKRWRLYDFPMRYPLLSDTFDTIHYSPPTPSHDITLGPGDMLYVPRGMAHDATSTQDSKSVHITVGLFPPMWTDLFETKLLQLRGDVRFRRAPANFFLTDRTDTFAADCEKMCHEAFGEADINEILATTLRRHLTRQSRMTEGWLGNTSAGLSLHPSTVLQARKNLVWQIEHAAKSVAVYFYDKRLVLPSTVRQAVDRLLSGDRFAIGQLQANLDTASSVVISRTFLEAGLIEIVT